MLPPFREGEGVARLRGARSTAALKKPFFMYHFSKHFPACLSKPQRFRRYLSVPRFPVAMGTFMPRFRIGLKTSGLADKQPHSRACMPVVATLFSG